MSKIKRLKKSEKNAETSSQDSKSFLTVSDSSNKNSDTLLLKQEVTSELPSSNAANDFKKDIEASRAAIVTEEKKGRGRKKLPRDANGNIIRETPTQPAPLEPQIQVPPPDKFVIKATLKMPFDALAHRTGCKDLSLQEIEADSLAEQATPLVAAWFPQMQSKETALVIFAFNFGVVAFSKYLIYKEYMKQFEAKDENQNG